MVVAHGLRCPGACGIFWEQRWDLCPLAGKFFTTELPAKPLTLVDFVTTVSLAGEPQPFLLKRILAIPPPGSRQHPVRSPVSPHPPRSQLAARRGEGRVGRGAGQMDPTVTWWWRRQ